MCPGIRPKFCARLHTSSWLMAVRDGLPWLQIIIRLHILVILHSTDDYGGQTVVSTEVGSHYRHKWTAPEFVWQHSDITLFGPLLVCAQVRPLYSHQPKRTAPRVKTSSSVDEAELNEAGVQTPVTRIETQMFNCETSKFHFLQKLNSFNKCGLSLSIGCQEYWLVVTLCSNWLGKQKRSKCVFALKLEEVTWCQRALSEPPCHC